MSLKFVYRVPLTTGLHLYVNTCSPPSSSTSSSSFSSQSSSHHHHRHHLHRNHSHHYSQQHYFIHHNHNPPPPASPPPVFMGMCNRKIKLHLNISFYQQSRASWQVGVINSHDDTWYWYIKNNYVDWGSNSEIIYRQMIDFIASTHEYPMCMTIGISVFWTAAILSKDMNCCLMQTTIDKNY